MCEIHFQKTREHQYFFMINFDCWFQVAIDEEWLQLMEWSHSHENLDGNATYLGKSKEQEKAGSRNKTAFKF